MTSTEAWILRAGPRGVIGALERTTIALGPLAPDEVLAEPLFGSWEGNMSHALARDPICVATARGEPLVVLGNAGVVRVLATGAEVTDLREGDACAFYACGQLDAQGYMETVHGYDAPGTFGLLAKRTKVPARTLVKLPERTQYALEQWAAFSLRYFAAFSNWRVAYGCYRVQTTLEEEPAPRVWAWGGGTSLAELTLAKHHGCDVTLLAGSDARIAEAKALGIEAIDRRPFAALSASDASDDARAEAEARFLALVRERTGGKGVSIFLEYLGGPVWRPTLKALSRQGVLASAGWKLGMHTEVKRAVECIRRHTHVYTHGARRSEAVAATAFAEAHAWIPAMPPRVTPWEEIPALGRAHMAGDCEGYFPVFRVAG